MLESEGGEGDEGDVEPGKHRGEKEGDRPAEEEEGGGQTQRLNIGDHVGDHGGVFNLMLKLVPTWSRE